MRFGFVLGTWLVAGGCSQSLPSLDGESKQQTSASAAAVVATSTPVPSPPSGSATFPPAAKQAMPIVPAGPSQIVGFKTATVTFYSSESSFDGERHATSSISVPLRTRGESSGSGRVEIATVSGPRWVDRSEIVLGPIEAANKR